MSPRLKSPTIKISPLVLLQRLFISSSKHIFYYVNCINSNLFVRFVSSHLQCVVLSYFTVSLRCRLTTSKSGPVESKVTEQMAKVEISKTVPVAAHKSSAVSVPMS